MYEKQNKKNILAAAYPLRTELKNGRSVIIRPLSTDDGERLAHFYARIPPEHIFFYCPHPLDRQHALAKAERADSPCFVCLILETVQGEIAGYAWYQWQPDSEKSSFGICIRQDHHGLGAGGILLTNLLQTAALYGPPAMSLTVQRINAGAVRLYQKCGFSIIREQQRKSDNEPEYYMEKTVR